MPLNFPTGISANTIYSYNSISYIYNGSAWDLLHPAGIPTISWTLSASGNTAYVFNGPGIESGNTENPALFLYRGLSYNFINTTGNVHPLSITVSLGGNVYTRGVTGSNTASLTFTVPMDAPNILYYQCTEHSSMGNIINIV